MQPYSITIDSEKNVESFCIFFETGLAEEAHRSLFSKTEQLLDSPELDFAARMNFVQKLYPRGALAGILSEVKLSVQQNTHDQVWLREKLLEVMRKILLQQVSTFREIEKLPALRTSTREELYRRIYRARDFIAASYDERITLDEMSKIACLSPSHFLRTFKSVFCQTPHQYLTGLRLTKAKKLLDETDMSIIAICQCVGFESHASFSLLFRRHFALSPEMHRRKNR